MFRIAMSLAVANADCLVAIGLDSETDYTIVLLDQIVAEGLIKLERIADMVCRAQIKPDGELGEILHHRTLQCWPPGTG